MNKRSEFLRRQFIFKIILSLTVTTLIIYLLYTLNTGVKPNRKNFHGQYYEEIKNFNFEKIASQWLTLKQTCPAPRADPHDPIVNKFIKQLNWSCPYKTPLTYLTESGLILINKTVLPPDGICHFSFMWNQADNDNFMDYHDFEVIPPSGVQLTNERDQANVSCVNGKGIRVYRNTHLIVPDFPKTGKPGAPSVFFFFIESLSALSFHRFMPLTKKVLKSWKHLNIFDNFVKPMENSFPNSIAAMTGKRVPWEEEKVLKKGKFDKVLPYIWDDFKEAGYVTAIMEDMAQIGVFNYGKKGFMKKPVDWYPRAYWLQMYPNNGDFSLSKVMSNSSWYCFEENGAKVDLFLEQTERFLKKQWQAKQPYFFWAFNSQSTHEDFNSFATIDRKMAEFLKRTKTILSDSLVVFAGDHGPRFGRFCETSMGRLEERMPFVSMRVGDSLDKKHPHLRKFLAANSNRLVTWYDVHKMMRDLVNKDFNPIKSNQGNYYDQNRQGPVSIWRELVPPGRNCSDANIDLEHCYCNGHVYLIPGCNDAYYAGNALVKHAKLMAEKHTKDKNCFGNKFNETISAEYFLPQDGTTFMKEKIRVKLKVMPSGGIIEGILVKNRKVEDKWEISVHGKDDIDTIVGENKLVNAFCGK